MLFVFLEFGATVGQPLNEKNKNIMAWFEKVSGGLAPLRDGEESKS